MRAPYAAEWFKSKRKDLRGISFQQHGSNSKSISQVVNSSVCGRAEQNAEVCIEVYLIAILLLIFQLPFLLLLRSAIYCGIRCSALLINSCRSPGMLALRGASSFSGFQGPCLHVEEHRRAGGGGGATERQMDPALWPTEIGKAFCSLLIECLTTGRSPNVKQSCFMLSHGAPIWPTCWDGIVRSWQLLSSAPSADAIEAWWMALLWE